MLQEPHSGASADATIDPRDAEIARLRAALAQEVEARRRFEQTRPAADPGALAAIDGIPGFIGILAADGNVERVNRQILEYCGATLDELRKWSLIGVVHPDDLPRNIALFSAAIAAGAPYDHEIRLRRHDGAYRWFSNRGVPVKDGAGTVLRWYVLLTDIDDRKRAEDLLFASERNLRETINAIPTLAWCNRPDGSNEFLNQRWHDYTGLPPEKANGWGWQVTLHPDDLPGLLVKWTHMLASGEPGELEARLRRHDGVYRWFLFRCDPLRDAAGNIVKWYGTNTDIEDLKRAEAGLRLSETVLAQGEEISETGSFLWKAEAAEIQASAQLYRICGFEPGSPVTLARINERLHPQDRALAAALTLQARAGLDVEYEPRLLMPDGSVRYLHYVARRIHDSDGRIVELTGTVQDVTSRKLAEQENDRVRSELTHAARAMSLGVLTASLAHEVNQPLAGITTNANTCVRMLSADPPNVKGALETARRTIRDANRTSDVVGRIRMLFAKKEFAAETVDLTDAAREVLALTAHELQRHHIAVATQFAPDPVAVIGDRVQIQQVILNFLLNARDAVKDAANGARTITIGTGLDDSGCGQLSVRDSGAGIAPESLGRIFDPFYTTKADGMGIGLSVSRSIVDRHRGRIWAANSGLGATFAFAIPAEQPAA